WLIGFAGYIIALLDKGYQSLISFYKKKMGSTAPPYAPPIDIDAKLEAFEGRLANIENKLIKEELSQETVYRSDRKSTRLNSSHVKISYAVFCLKKKKKK